MVVGKGVRKGGTTAGMGSVGKVGCACMSACVVRVLWYACVLLYMRLRTVCRCVFVCVYLCVCRWAQAAGAAAGVVPSTASIVPESRCASR